MEDVVEEKKLFHFHEKPNLDCPIRGNLQIVLAVILIQVQEIIEQVFRKYDNGTTRYIISK
ncbi:hypothetical protein M3215_09960 [Bacillus cytotoxicus]|uniref:Uncharacterized protein n=1 Tax=Bacillus cytotoxicus TaxID=580165 RepID=A0ACC6A6D3_9BACI|nr:hypothetical protein [Bacillus cytotoxicus]